MSDYTPHQQKIIKRYYSNQDTILHQRLAELAGELYLAQGKSKDRLWKRAGEVLAKLGLPPARVEHVLAKKDPALLPVLLQELEQRGS